MAKTADTIAIYSRKSRYTGKGESIGNQIDLCREYIRTHYGDAAAQHAVVFEDEGFSGGNLNRPDFKKMMTAAKERKIRAIVVYRLDRISRNISDFSSLIEELGRLGIDFVSIRESFDTSSPMGRAMMYIASVFSQLEREIIGHFASIEKCTCYHTKNISLFLFHKKMPIHKTSPCEHSMYAGTRHLF